MIERYKYIFDKGWPVLKALPTCVHTIISEDSFEFGKFSFAKLGQDSTEGVYYC